MNNNVIINAIPALKDNYIWIMINNDEKKAIVVDPGDASSVFDYLRENKLTLAGIVMGLNLFVRAHLSLGNIPFLLI